MSSRLLLKYLLQSKQHVDEQLLSRPQGARPMDVTGSSLVCHTWAYYGGRMVHDFHARKILVETGAATVY